MSQTVNLIMSISTNGVIGNNGEIPWDLPDEQKRFRNKTLGHVVIMGRTTWENLNYRPLAGRDCVVLSRQEKYEAVGATVYDSLEKTLAAYPDREIWIAGGAQVFEQAQHYADTIHSTIIDDVVEGDASFDLKVEFISQTSTPLQDYVRSESERPIPVYEFIFKLK